MKKLGMLSLIVGSLWLGACSDDDKDFMLDVNRMTGVDWYYNRTTSKNYLSFSDENVLEINRFDKSGEIKGIDLRGVIDSVAGVWRDEGENVLAVDWKNGNSESWTVENCTSKKFVVKAGFMEGKVMDAAETNAIAKLPNREGMLSMFAGALTSTLSGLAVAMQAYADKQEEPAA